MFSHRADVWDTDAETTGAVLAVHAATAISAQRQEEQLQAALLTRDRIGQAKGIIMVTYGVKRFGGLASGTRRRHAEVSVFASLRRD